MKLLVVDSGGASDTPEFKETFAVLTDAFKGIYEVVEGPVEPCSTCGYFDCVCVVRTQHKESCPFRRAMESKIGISCDEHESDVCAICDACDCK